MDSFKDRYPKLEYLLNAYFHMDWTYDHDSFEAAIEEFMEKESLETVVGVADDIGIVLGLKLDENELDDLLMSSDSSYYIWRQPETKIKDWLFKLANKLYERAYS